MLDIYLVNKQIEQIKDNIEKLKISLKIDDVKLQIKELEEKTLDAFFWEDKNVANNIIATLNQKKQLVSSIDELESLILELYDEIELYELDNLDEFEKEINKDLKKLEDLYTHFEINTLLNDKHDKDNAILTIHPGAGGTESCDWANMLYRMYIRYAQKEGFSYEVLDFDEGDVAGIKSVSILIKGQNAYGKLKSEHGVHRLVRISPFDSNKRRHTSFASVEVMPEIDDNIDIKINEDDLKIDYFRASGAGGQHINKTSSAIRILHIPTGIVVSCQTQRSQFQNKANAMKMLKSKLIQLEEQKQKENKDKLKGEVLDIAWGSQIRNYVFCPYTLVKDSRTKYEEHNIDFVMDGNIDGFIFDYLKFINNK